LPKEIQHNKADETSANGLALILTNFPVLGGIIEQ